MLNHNNLIAIMHSDNSLSHTVGHDTSLLYHGHVQGTSLEVRGVRRGGRGGGVYLALSSGLQGD